MPHRTYAITLPNYTFWSDENYDRVYSTIFYMEKRRRNFDNYFDFSK